MGKFPLNADGLYAQALEERSDSDRENSKQDQQAKQDCPGDE
jgi:hypothetical protein